MSCTKEQIAAALDLAVLKPTAATGDVIAAARLVKEENLAAVCVAPCNVRLATQYTNRVCAVIGFPHGTTTPEVKEYEARQAIANGAIELDVVCNYSYFLDGTCSLDDPPFDRLGIGGVVSVAHKQGVLSQGHPGDLLHGRKPNHATLRNVRPRGRGFREDFHRLRSRRGNARGRQGHAADCQGA